MFKRGRSSNDLSINIFNTCGKDILHFAQTVQLHITGRSSPSLINPLHTENYPKNLRVTNFTLFHVRNDKICNFHHK